MTGRVLLAVVAALGLLVGAAAVALGEDSPVRIVEKGDTFPAALGYAAVGLATAVWGILVGVIAKLYYGGQDKDKARAEAEQAWAKALAAEKDARREEAERLLREQTALLREVLTASSEKTAAYGKLTDAVQANTLVVQHLVNLVGEK